MNEKKPKGKIGKRFFPTLEIDEPTIEENFPEGEVTKVTEFLEASFRYQPRQSEARHIAAIEKAAGEVITDLFAYADVAMRKLYEQAQVPVLVDGKFVADKNGEPEYAVGDDGELVYDFSRIDGMDIEKAIMILERVVYRASEEVTKLHARTVFAQSVKEDEFWEGYRSVLRGTIEDRKAMAYKASQDSRYYFFYMWWVFKLANEKLQQVIGLKKDLEWLRMRLLKGSETKPWG